MNEKARKTLEYNKILAQLEELAGSAGGKALCRDLLPSSDPEQIAGAMRETSDARDRLAAKGSLTFSGVHDVRLSVKRTEVASPLNITELLQVQHLLTMTGRAKSYGRRELRETSDSLDAYFDALEPLSPLGKEISRCIISEEEIADDASPGLLRVRRQMRGIADKIHSQLSSLLISSRTYLQDGVITMRDGRYCLPVKTEHKSQVPGLVHDQSGSGSTLFIEPMAIVRLNNELRELELAQQREIELVLAALSQSVSAHTNEICENFRLLTLLDFIFAKAKLSRNYRGIEPEFSTDRYMHLKQARHPLLPADKVVPIDIRLGKDFDLLIVTGPNTGGKTVSLKTAGLLTLMGQAGLHIPAAPGSRLAIFSDVFADIGDEQSIEQSLSTFSAHMTNIVRIIREADTNSLVLFDELGAGTDPVEGAALAMAILSRFHSLGIRTMATTHYSELKIFALSTPGVENASCEFSVETLRPTYRLMIGIPGKSNAFAIAGKLGLPAEIIDNAGSFIGSNEEAFEDVLSQLEQRRVQMEQAEREIRRLQRETELLQKEAAKKQGGLEEQKEKILRQAREEARDILQQAKDTADKAIRELHKQGARVTRDMEDTRAGLRVALDSAQTSAAGSRPVRKAAKPADKLKVGDSVQVLSLNLKGIVSSLPDSGGHVTVQMGILRSKVHISDLELLHEETATISGKRAVSHGSSGMTKALSISPEINLIGKTVADALSELDKYIDDAYLAHLGKVRIIHGRGTGALKNAVSGFLRRNKHVDKFYTADFNEGGYGATVAELKS